MRELYVTFISLVCFPEIDNSDGFEVEIPQPDTAVPAPRGKALLTGIHAENPRLEEKTVCQWGCAPQMNKTAQRYSS